MRSIYTSQHRAEPTGPALSPRGNPGACNGVGQHCRLTPTESALTESPFLWALYWFARPCTRFRPNLRFLQKIDGARSESIPLSGHQCRKWQEMGYQTEQKERPPRVPRAVATGRKNTAAPMLRNTNTPVNHRLARTSGTL